MQGALVAMWLIFAGAGPGAGFGYDLQLVSVADRSVRSFKFAAVDRLAFLRSAAAGRGILGIQGFGSGTQVVTYLDLAGGAIRRLGEFRGLGVFYPALSPDESTVAALVVSDRIDLPPRSYTGARLITFPVGSGVMAGGGRADARAPVSTQVADGLPVTPMDWSRDGKTVFFASKEREELMLRSYSPTSGRTVTIGAGVFPRCSPDGARLAHIDKRNIVIRKVGSWTIEHTHTSEWPVAWIDWNSSGDSLAFVEEGPVYRSRLSVLDVKDHSVRVVLETGSIRYLAWVAGNPSDRLVEWAPR